MHHDKSVTLVVRQLSGINGTLIFLSVGPGAYCRHAIPSISPQVVVIVENIWLVVVASIVLVFCLVFVMPEEHRIMLLC